MICKRIYTFHHRFASGNTRLDEVKEESMWICSRAISADRRGIEPDSYVFEVPEHEEAPLEPLKLTDRRGNLRKQNSFRYRYDPKDGSRTYGDFSSTSEPSEASNADAGGTGTPRRSMLARLFAKRKTDSQESTLVKPSTTDDDLSPPRTSVRPCGMSNHHRIVHLLDADGQSRFGPGKWSCRTQ